MIGRRVTVPGLVLALAVMTGCGGAADEPRSTGSGGPDAVDSADVIEESEACALLSQVEVSEAVGTEVGPGRGSSGGVATGGTQSTCEWFSVEQPADTAKLTIYSETTAADSVKDADSEVEPLPGVGDAAFVGSYASVWVYQGERSFMAQWYSMTAGDAENLPRSEALARLAAERL